MKNLNMKKLNKILHIFFEFRFINILNLFYLNYQLNSLNIEIIMNLFKYFSKFEK